VSGDNAVAATQGDESAFASSDDDGYTFNDISMVNTVYSRVADFANSADGMANYLTTYDTTEGTGNYDVSVWSKVGFAWHRVLSMRDVAVDTEAHWNIRIAPDDPAVILLNPCGTRYIWVNQESGGGKWNKRSCKVDPIQDFIAESADVIYAISTSTFSKSINGGSSWSTEVGFEGKQPYMITLAPNNDILMGTLDGSIIYSKDGGSSFSATSVSGFPVIVAADSNYADNGIVYYNSFTYKPVVARGVLGPMIIPKFIGIDLPDGTALPASYMTISDLAMVGDALYVLTDNGTASRLYRALNARDAVDSMKALWGYAESGSVFGHADYQPHPMKIAPNYVDFFTGTAMVKLSFVAYPASVISFGDPLTTQGVTLLAPANEAEVPVNPITGRAYDMTFSWNRFSEDQIVKCDVQVATDPAFDALIVDAAMDGITKDMIAQIIGPNSAYSDFRREFMPNTTYYWRVRVSGIKSGPWLSPWSEVRNFTVSGEIPFQIVSPEIGATGVSITPTLSWTEYPGAISYEVQVADGSIPEGITFAILDVSHSADLTFYNIEEPLKYSNTYYWRVRAAGTDEWVTGSFTTMAEPVPDEPIIIEPPPVTVQAPPPADITVEAAEPTFPEYLLWTIVGIGAVLVIALIVLIVRTRRVV